MKSRAPLLLLLAVPMLAGFDCGSGGNSKLDQCIKLGKAYCSQEIEVGCPDPTDPCTSEYCYDIFDGSCEASQADKDKVNHDIEMIIQSKSTCAGLRSVDEYLIGTIYDMASSDCVSGGVNTTRGDMCDEMITEYCEQAGTLGCLETGVTVELCISMSWASGLATFGSGYYCTDPNDTSEPTPADTTGFNAAMDEINSAIGC